MTKALSVKKESPWTQQQVELIKNTVAIGATNDELKLFLYTAARTGLDPLTKQIHFVKRWNSKLQKEVGAIQTGIDGYRAIAERTGELAGIEDAEFDDESGSHPNKAKVTVYRIVKGEKVSFSASARWSEYVQINNKTGRVMGLWEKMPYLMLGKCAEALALRKAFPNDLSGIYTNEEMQQADNDIKAEIAPAPDMEISDADIANIPHEGDFVEGVYEEVEKAQKPAGRPWEKWNSGNEVKKVCPICHKEHTGKYPKCLECWKAEKNGTAAPKTKKMVNEDAPPFRGDEFAK